MSLPNTDDEEALVNPTYNSAVPRNDQDKVNSSPAHDSTLACALHSLLESALSPPQPVCLKKKALLIGIQNYDSDGGDSPVRQLKGPHVDVRDMRQLLLDCYGYNSDDITVIIDDGNPEHMQPTEENLIRSMKDLVANARSGDEFYLHFSGHGTQVPDLNGDEEDGWDECIITCDHEIITDDTLNELLVTSLPPGCTFVSSFDSCHSGTVLDLAHYQCNRVYVPWVDKGVRRTVFIRNIVTRQETQITDVSNDSNTIQTPIIQVSEVAVDSSILPNTPPSGHTRYPNLSINTHLAASCWVDSAATPIKFSISPRDKFCTGTCRGGSGPESATELKADVISISATRDYQRSWETEDGFSMTEALIKVLRKDPHSSLQDVMTSISYELHDLYIHLHAVSRDYKDAVNKTNVKREAKGKPLVKPRQVEMDNFQHPEISSHRPLDMNRPWPLSRLKPCLQVSS